MSVLCFICLSLFSFGFCGSLAEVNYITDWASEVVNSGWDLSASYCTWEGFSCDPQNNLVSIDYSCPDTNPTLMGPLPPIDIWTDAFFNQTAFLKTNSIKFNYCLLGPSISDSFAETWIDGYPLNFNFTTPNGETPMFSCPIPDGLPSEITCSPTNIVSITPSGVPSAGGEIVALMNKQSNWAAAACLFTYDNEAGSSIMVPASNSFVGVQSTLTCRAPAGQDPFSVDIVVDSEIITNAQPSFAFGYLCPPGTGGNGCADCPVGTYKSSFGADCVPTPVGGYQSDAGATDFNLCPEGTVAPTAGSTSISDCTVVCHAGTYASADGCVDCPVGTFSGADRATECTACPPGWASAPGSTSCTACAAGSAAVGSQCTPCPSSYFAAVSGTVCSPCQEGFTNNEGFTGCTACPAGFFRLSTMDTCELCLPGTFTATEGNAYCTVCPINQIAADSGATGCTACPDGLVTLYTGQSRCRDSPPSSGGNNHASFVAGIVLTAVGGSFIIFSALVAICFFGIYYPKENAELKGISSQMGDLAKSST